MDKKSLLLAAAIAAMVLASGCVTEPPQNPSNGETPTNGGNGTLPPDDTTPGVKEVVVEGSEYAYSPETITVNEGDTVKITFKNTGERVHNFVIDEFSVRTPTITGGKESKAEFVASQKGTFAFYCSVPGHRAAGMEGQLVVE